MVHEFFFTNSNWSFGVATVFSLVVLGVLAGLVWKRKELQAWRVVLSIIAIGVSGAVAGLAWRDCATKLAFVRLETAPPRLTLERRWPRRPLVLVPGELGAVGLLTLGAELDDEQGGQRQLLIGVAGEKEMRSFLEYDPPKALAIAAHIAEAMGVELQRFAGPPPLRSEDASD